MDKIDKVNKIISIFELTDAEKIKLAKLLVEHVAIGNNNSELDEIAKEIKI